VANNRAYLRCKLCLDEAQAPRFYLAKYYPSTGWYTQTRAADDLDSCSVGLRTREQFTLELDKWFDQHTHGSLFGDFLELEYE
jgi:hypothetical protein